MPLKRQAPDVYVAGIMDGNRALLSQAITLAESTLPTDKILASNVLEHVMPHTGQSFRLGITGAPGVGKSTFIEAFGLLLIGKGHKLAVLAIDPSSQRTGGSILGDKTRMNALSAHPNAYVRPSPAGDALGGVNWHTREAILLCEAAGHDIVIVETVGVGQSETLVHGMVDFFLLLQLPGGGDSLQGIKRGIVELADGIVVTKADDGREALAARTLQEFLSALHLLAAAENNWEPFVLACSALTGVGLDPIWERMLAFRTHMQRAGHWHERRRRQQVAWLSELVDVSLKTRLNQHPDYAALWKTLSAKVAEGLMPAPKAAESLMRAMFK